MKIWMFKNQNPNQENFDKANKSYIKIKKEASFGSLIKTGLIFIVFSFLLFYLFLPAINLHDESFWLYLFIIVTFGIILLSQYNFFNKKFFYPILTIFLGYLILNLTSLEIFNAKKYSNIIQITDGNFKEDVKEIPSDKIPTVDRDSAIRLGSRKMGEIIDLVSQFNIDQTYTQVNLKGDPVRVTPLEYNGFLKYISNFKDGIPHYMSIDMIDGDAHLVKLEENIKYSKSDYLFRNINRHIRFKYPTDIIRDIEFEVDDQGRPYWVAASYTSKIGWFGAKDVKEVILVDAINGESNKYKLDEVPSWIDRVYNADRVIQQLNWHGSYKLGFINSKFAQKQVLNTTEGYNYLSLDDDIYLYTGFTSVASDESNVGFILSNLRTKETRFYPVSSAEEYSAMSSAQGAVQEKNYIPTFPILLNIQGKPTYFLSLKDNAGLIKLYAFVDAQKYQDVSIGNTVSQALASHLSSNIVEDEENDRSKIKSIEGSLSDIKSVVIDGNTHYYFIIDEKDEIFVSDIKLSEKLAFLKLGDKIKFEYIEGDINKLISLE